MRTGKQNRRYFVKNLDIAFFTFILGGNIGLLTGMCLITLLELVLWVITKAWRICFRFKKSENLETKKDSKLKGKMFLTPVLKKKKRNKKSVIVGQVLQKKISPKKM